MNILFVGIGGVGGYFGGLLARYAADHPGIKVHFLARGAHLGTIEKNGLQVIDREQEPFFVRPAVVADRGDALDAMDYIFICTKSYDLESVVTAFTGCVSEHTVIIPLLNGVDSRERILKLLPSQRVCEGCVYIVARLQEPGVVVNLGNSEQLFFGLDNHSGCGLSLLERVLQAARIKAVLAGNIQEVIWEKFIFLAPLATATSYFDMTIGEILDSETAKSVLWKLLEEVVQLANEKNIPVVQLSGSVPLPGWAHCLPVPPPLCTRILKPENRSQNWIRLPVMWLGNR